MTFIDEELEIIIKQTEHISNKQEAILYWITEYDKTILKNLLPIKSMYDIKNIPHTNIYSYLVEKFSISLEELEEAWKIYKLFL